MNPLGPKSGAAGLAEIMAMRQDIIARSQLLQQVRAPQPAGNEAQGPADGFGDALKSALDGVKAVQTRAQHLSEAYERGEVTDVAKVMLARQESGLAFEATLQVRNRLISAYQEIMRMGV